jgi:hypothetical protein
VASRVSLVIATGTIVAGSDSVRLGAENAAPEYAVDR